MTAIIRQFLKLEAAGGILLIIAALIALVMANTPLSAVYQSFLDIPVAVKFSALEIDKPLLLWINDALMAIFFLVVGLEVKRELMVGSLAGRDKAMFPAIAALGGMVAPALVYLLFNGGDTAAAQGWAIPAATDIAFALGVMALLGKRVPTELKVFLLAALMVVVLCVMNLRNVSNTAAYMMWVCILKSGVHATLAGVIVGFLIPLRSKDGEHSPSEELEHVLHPWVAYLILPLFAFANAGVSVQGISFDALMGTLPLGILLGLFIGKPLGIFTACLISVKLGFAKLPERITLNHIFAVSVLCGIGFTMSIFIAGLAFTGLPEAFNTYSKLGILIGSTMAAVTGLFLLHSVLPKKTVRQ
ncbi:Na+/H+ antiporter NhaA [Morganella morganii]|uniref:Na(+)/H(+) antiporter NhaA n=1 Tax=Morganella morganii TaxID=582 RepID=A0A433ZXN6_MORMO|nr:Na+/H+ antiporter NhaA [Morganella morganii]RUT66901.1 Na+/H+ antiporter NhaA [Morganella morganii]